MAVAGGKMATPRESGLAAYLHSVRDQISTGCWIAFWVVISVSIIIVNKHVMFYSGFRFPFALAVWHMLLGTITARTAVWALRMPDAIREHASFSFYAQVAMIGVLFGGTLVTGNAALLYLTVPTVQMLKASGPASIYTIGIIMGNEKLGGMQALKVLVVCTGVGIASYGDVTMSAAGFMLQIVSIFMDAVRCCSLQRVLQANHIEAGPLVTLAHVAPFAMAALLLPAIVYEGPRLISDYPRWRHAVPMVVLSGALASVLNLVVFKIIRLTSALTTSLSGVIKEWACILVAMYVYGTHVTGLQWLGYSIAIAGLLWYQSGRIMAAQPPAAKAALGKSDEDEAPLIVSVDSGDATASPPDSSYSPASEEDPEAGAVAGGGSAHMRASSTGRLSQPGGRTSTASGQLRVKL